MKKFLLPAVLLGAFALNAQNVQRCSSFEYKQQKLNEHPEYQQMFDQQEADYQTFLQNHPNGYSPRAVVTIPVVFHVVYNTTAQNISTTRLIEQINVLNADYRKQNSDASLVPSYFAGVAADCEVQFCLAHRDPNGNWTDGVERIQTSTTSFNTNDNVKYTSSGGADGWDRDKYLNIWVCNLGSSLLGYASFPGGAAGDDGVVLHYKYVGVTGATAPYNKGRTATHEVGHWLWLLHIWGDDGTACTGSDQCADTPNQADEHYGCPSGSQVSCTNGPNGDMWMNFMDYTDDACMYMFTENQKARMWTILTSTRQPLQTSDGCDVTTVAELTLKNHFSVYPSPSNGQFTVEFANTEYEDLDISVTNTLGQQVYTRHLDAITENQFMLDLSNEAPGVYLLEIRNKRERVSRKVVIE